MMTTPETGPTLKEYFEKLFSLHATAHIEHTEAHAREHAFAQDAIKTAATLSKENKEDANEWRSTMDDRERTFATKQDIAGLSDKISILQNSEIKRAETERLRLIHESEEKRQDERRQSRQQWTVGIAVGLFTFFSALLVNILIRLLST